jgi:hypothetical protein
VSELGDLLELLYGAGDRWRNARLTLREWHHFERAARAQERAQTSRSAHQIMLYGGGGPMPVEQESVVRVWIDGERAREERDDPQLGPMLMIRDGERWSHYSQRDGARTNDGDRNHHSGVGQGAMRLLEPSHVLAALKLRPAEEVEVAGRQAMRVVATGAGPHESAMLLFQLGYGADEYELLVDRERGVLLRTAALLHGEPFAVSEVTEIAFDEEFPPETFVFTLPEGEAFRPLFDRPAHVTLEAAAARAPFVVLTPASVPDDWQLHVMLSEGSDRPPMPPSVHLHYHSRDASHQLHIEQTATEATGTHDWLEWADEGSVRIAGPRETTGTMPTYVQVDRGGTRATLSSSDLELAALMTLAQSLHPAPKEPPRIT